jgi:hypothetical protein
MKAARNDMLRSTYPTGEQEVSKTRIHWAATILQCTPSESSLEMKSLIS